MKISLRLGIVLAALFLASALCGAEGEPGTVAITAPAEGLTISSESVEIEASYAASGDAVVQLVELLVDGVKLDARPIEPSQAKGTVSFTWAPRGYGEGLHRLAVRAVDSTGEAAEGAIDVWLERAFPSPDRGVRIVSPEQGATVVGKTAIQVAADEPAAVRYVIFLVDDVFKAMSNVRPFAYIWDTTRYLNGLHQLKAKTYLAGGREAVTPVVQVRVANVEPLATRPRPRVQSEAVVGATPAEPPARAGEPTLPPPMRSESTTDVQPVLTVSEPEVAAPGTAPFVHTTGALIRPLSKSASTAGPRAQPVQLAVPPAAIADVASETPNTSPSAPAPARSPAESALTAARGGEVVAAEAREPSPAPVEVALSFAGEERAMMPAQEARTAASPAWESAPAGQAEAATADAVARPSPIQIAMLPPEPAEPRLAPKLTAGPAPADIVYVVQAGDWLRGIAARYGVSPEELARANNMANPDLITPGQKLVIPSTPTYFDSTPLKAEVPTFIANGRAIVPFRPIIEEAGGTVVWEGPAKRASAAARGHAIAVTIDSDRAQVDGSYVTMCTPAALLCGRTVVPARFLGDVLDLVLQYQDGILHIASM